VSLKCACGAESPIQHDITENTTFTCKDCLAKKVQRLSEVYPAEHVPAKKWGKKKVREAISHNHFERLVENRLKDLGCNVFRNGWPDYLAVKNNKPIWIEVKHGQDKLQESQIEMFEALRSIGIEVRVLSLNNGAWRDVLEKWTNEKNQ
jgi:hypothetical protein